MRFSPLIREAESRVRFSQAALASVTEESVRAAAAAAQRQQQQQQQQEAAAVAARGAHLALAALAGRLGAGALLLFCVFQPLLSFWLPLFCVRTLCAELFAKLPQLAPPEPDAKSASSSAAEGKQQQESALLTRLRVLSVCLPRLHASLLAALLEWQLP